MNRHSKRSLRVFPLFQFSEDFIGTHTLGKQFLQNGFRFCFLCFFCSLSICLCLLCFQGCYFFFGLLQSRLLLFQSVLLLFNRFLDGCDLGVQRRNRLLLLCDLGYVDFPSPGSPCSSVIFPIAIKGYHSHRTSVD